MTSEYGPSGNAPDRSDEGHGYDTCDGSDHVCQDYCIEDVRLQAIQARKNREWAENYHDNWA